MMSQQLLECVLPAARLDGCKENAAIYNTRQTKSGSQLGLSSKFN